MSDEKDILKQYLRSACNTLLWKLDGLSEYDIRRPMTPTGTNLLGLVKHVANVGAEYFGFVLGRPFPETMPWFTDDAGPNADMWATPDESREFIVGFYERVQAHTADTIDALELTAEGEVPWWGPGGRHTTMHTLLVHMIAEVNRHAGHADIIRELIDGAAGHRPGGSNLPDDVDWPAFRAHLEEVARRF